MTDYATAAEVLGRSLLQEALEWSAVTPGDIVIGSATLAVVMYGLFEATLQLIRVLGR